MTVEQHNYISTTGTYISIADWAATLAPDEQLKFSVIAARVTQRRAQQKAAGILVEETKFITVWSEQATDADRAPDPEFKEFFNRYLVETAQGFSKGQLLLDQTEVNSNLKILVVGPSVTLGPEAWPNYIKNKLGCDLVNLSLIGAGNTYIHDTTIQEIARRQYDMVVVSWTYAQRWEFKTQHTAAVKEWQSLQNPHYDRLEKSWAFAHTDFADYTINSYREQLFRSHGALTNSRRLRLEATLIKIISLQSILKATGTPYLFTFYRPLAGYQIRFPELYAMLDWDNIMPEYLYTIAKNRGWIDIDHPSSDAHACYAELLLAKIRPRLTP